MTPLNTRFAPSPTGFFHLGSARTAYHNYLASRATGGVFMLRIDDTDLNRSDKSYVDLIYQCLDWLGIDYDTTATQSSRFDHYLDVAHTLARAGLATVAADKSISLNYPCLITSWSDLYSTSFSVSPKDQDYAHNITLIKSNQTPSYHFASVVDDIDFDINFVLRGSDHISNTPRQLNLRRALVDINYPKATSALNWFHSGLITFANGKKLSKRDMAANLLSYKTDGINPAAILNFVLKMAWSHPDPNFDRTQPLIDKDLASKIFWDGKLRSTSATFDLARLNWLNKKYNNKNSS